MPRSTGPSLHWLTLAVLLPLLALAALAWLGNRAQVKAAWSDAREAAGPLAAAQAERLGLELLDWTEDILLFPDPPPPGSPSPTDLVLDGTDTDALLALRDNPQAGLSPAGLPRRVLAALRLRQLDPEAQQISDIIQLVTKEEPSVLTGGFLRKNYFADSYETACWLRGEMALAAFRHHPDGGWVPVEGGKEPRLWWLQRSDDRLRYLTPDTLPAVLRATPDKLPRWATVRFSIDGKVVGPNTDSQSLLATAEVPMHGALQLEIVADSPALIEKPVRRQAAWMSALLAVSLVASLTGLFAIHRGVARERRLGELKSQFVSSVSHELRAPVGSIRLMAEALQAEKVDMPATFHSLIAREGERLSHLIENVLDFARIEEGRKRYRFEDSDLAALVRDAIAPMQPPAVEKNITIITELAEGTATVDPAAIQQALVNLLDNAIKFSPEESEIRVTLESTPDAWTISVADQGPGIPASEHRRIFERFHRLGDEMRRETQGTGIGLSIVQHITDAHHGKIRLTSEPGKGSTFTITFPQSQS